MNKTTLKLWKKCIVFCLVFVITTVFPVVVQAASNSGSITTLSACGDKLTVSWSANNNTLAANVNGSCAEATSTNSFQIKSAAYDGIFSDYDTNVVVTLTNTNSKTMNLDFSVSGSTPTISPGSGVVSNSISSGYSYTLDNGEYITISLYNSSPTAKYTTVSGIQFYSNEEVQVTYIPGANGSYSLTVDGETEPVSVTNAAGHKYGYSAVTSISVSASSGYKFVGWMTSAGRLLDYTSGTNLLAKPSEDITVYAYFVPTTAPKYQVGASYYYYWADAISAAVTGNATVLLVESGTLPNSTTQNKVDGTYVVNNGTTAAPKLEYKIPSGVNFVIPYSSTDTGDFDGSPDARGYEEDGARISTRSAYKTLTVSDGATVTCAGYLNVNAQQFTTSGSNPGCVMGQYGHLKLNGTNAKLNVSGNLYCYGYITGTGTVELTSTGELRELMQVMDWRGGNATSSAIEQSVFPFSQYYVQNVEADLIVNSGATSYACVAIEAGLLSKSVYQVIPEYIGSGGFFQLGSGAKITREYDTAKDCLNYTLSGGAVTMSSMELSLGGYSMNSAAFIFAINPNMNLTITETASITLTEEYKLLPNVDIVVNGTMTVKGDLYIYDYADWVQGGFANKSQANNLDLVPIEYIATTGKASTRTALEEASASITVNGTLTVTGGLYTTSDGNNTQDKVLKGTGKIVHTPSKTATTILEAESVSTTALGQTLWQVETTEISVTTVLGNLAGVGDLQSFGTGTYYGLGADHNNYWYKNKTVVAATCGTDGYTDYYCDDATQYYRVPGDSATGNHSYSDATYDTASTCSVCTGAIDSVCIGETPYSTLKEAVEAADADSTVTLLTDITGDIIISQNVTINKNGNEATITAGDGFAMTEVDGTVTIYELTVKIAGTSVTAADSLAIYFYVDVSPDEGDYYAVITRTKLEKDASGVYSNVQTVTKRIDSKDWVVSGGYLRFCYEGIAAKEMTDPVSVTIYDASGKQVSATITESIESYALRSLEKHTDTKLHTALVDMLNYGAAAQINFGYKTGDLANAELTTEQAGFATVSVSYVNITTQSKTDTYELAGATVTAESELYFTFYFSGITKPESLTAEISYTDHRGVLHEQTISGSDFLSYGSYYGPRVTGIAVADGATAITCTLKEGDTVVATATSSVVSYAVATIAQNKDNAEKADLVALCNMLMKFVNSAYAYFHQNDSVA